MMGISPKSIIIDQLKAKFETVGIKKVMLIYDIETEKTDIKGQSVEGATFDILLTKSENLLIQKMLIGKIKRLIKGEFKNIIISLDTENDSINLYTKDFENNMIKIDF